MYTKRKILVVDDDEDISDLIKVTLETDGYDVVIACDGVDALMKVHMYNLSLIISDVDMPRMGGLELVQELRRDVHYRLIPIIILSGSRTAQKDRLDGLQIGADEYMIKPFSPPELSIRVKHLIDRTEEHVSVNPLTRLPGSHSLEIEVSRRLGINTDLALCYFDIDHFKAYNDSYGYQKGDTIIKGLADIITGASSNVGSGDDFLTHIGGDDFILVTSVASSQLVCQNVIDDFSNAVTTWYSPEDIQRGYISSVNRKNEKQNFPTMTISIAIVTNENRHFDHYAQIVDVLSEIKRFAKTIPGNVYIKDRRKEREK